MDISKLTEDQQGKLSAALLAYIGTQNPNYEISTPVKVRTDDSSVLLSDPTHVLRQNHIAIDYENKTATREPNAQFLVIDNPTVQQLYDLAKDPKVLAIQPHINRDQRLSYGI